LSHLGVDPLVTGWVHKTVKGNELPGAPDIIKEACWVICNRTGQGEAFDTIVGGSGQIMSVATKYGKVPPKVIKFFIALRRGMWMSLQTKFFKSPRITY